MGRRRQSGAVMSVIQGVANDDPDLALVMAVIAAAYEDALSGRGNVRANALDWFISGQCRPWLAAVAPRDLDALHARFLADLGVG